MKVNSATKSRFKETGPVLNALLSVEKCLNVSGLKITIVILHFNAYDKVQ